MLGKRIRRRRKELGLSLRELGEASGVTASFLSLIERDKASPSISSLQQIAQALNSPLFELLVEEHDTNPVVRAGERTRITLPSSNLTYELLVPDLNRNMELFLTELEPGDFNLARPLNRPTEECIFVLQGRLLVRLDDRDFTLERGDSIYFEGVRLRELRSVGKEKVVFLSAITPPAF